MTVGEAGGVPRTTAAVKAGPEPFDSLLRPGADHKMQMPHPPYRPMSAVTVDRSVLIRYTNYRGECSVRRILPQRLEFVSSEWHPEPQWVLHALDLDRGVERSFALRDVEDFDVSDLGADSSPEPSGPADWIGVEAGETAGAVAA